MLHKLCSRCKTHKPTEAFSKKKSNKDGLYGWCKVCCSEHKRSKATSISAYKKVWTSNNRDKVRVINSHWYSTNQDKKSAYKRHRYANNLNHRISCVLRSRLSHAINNKGNISAVRDLGCTIEHLKKHLESKFLLGMSWDNYGNWHIDHIIPISSFNLSDDEQVRIACHYTNLQPLWATDNLIKGSSTYTT